jgi:(2R)-sulfolactate sulfo-lyase subunit alpha
VTIPHFLVHSPKDNVGVVVVEGLKAGTPMTGVVTETDTTVSLTAAHDIPIGHKVALKPLKPGQTVIKYGADIGKMVGPAGVGEHVHTHNLKTKRW